MVCVQNKFHEKSIWPTSTGSGDFASFDINGKAVEKIQNPVKLILRPVAKLPDQEENASSCNVENKVLDSLSTIPVGSTIWNVFGIERVADLSKTPLPEIPIG